MNLRDLLEGRTTLANERGLSKECLTALQHDAINLWANGRSDDALIILRGLRALDPTHLVTLRLLGQLLAERGVGQEALRYLDQALKLRSNSPALRVTRAQLRLAIGRDIRGAIHDLQIAADHAGTPFGDHAHILLKKIATGPQPT